jgi:hypothetical protein
MLSKKKNLFFSGKGDNSRLLEAYLSAIQFIANCILLISIFKLELSPFPQKNNFF